MTAVQTKQAQATETECLALVKHLTRTSISVLSYLRELFPEDAFEERNVSGKLGVKLLRRGIDDGADQLLDVLERGVFDALEKKYLKTLVIGVSVDGDKPDTLVESYIVG